MYTTKRTIYSATQESHDYNELRVSKTRAVTTFVYNVAEKLLPISILRFIIRAQQL